MDEERDAIERDALGEAYKTGGWGGVAAEAGGRGNFQVASQAQTAQAQGDERTRQARERRMAVFNNVLSGLRNAPYEQRKARIQQLAPRLIEEGFTQEQIAAYDPTDERIAGDLAMAGQLSQYAEIKQDAQGRWTGVTRDGRVVPIEGAPQPAQVETLAGDAATGVGLRPGTVAQRDPTTGEIKVVQAPREFAPGSGGAGGGDISADPERIRLEREFAKDWKNVSTDFQGIKDQMGRIETMAARSDSAGDLALVVSFTKMLDPGSVAREGEVALTQSAASAAAQAQNYLPRLQEGNTLLPPQVRAQLLSAAREMFGVYNNAYRRLAGDYQATAQQYGYAPERVMMGYRESDAQPVPGRGMPEHGGRYQMANGTVGIYDRETNKFYAEGDPRAPGRPNQLGPTRGAEPPRPPNVPRNWPWDSRRNMFVPPEPGQ
jgi:hypothetical protein